MTRKNNHNDERASQPTWEDTTIALKVLSSLRPGIAVITLDTDGCTPTRGAMRVRVSWYPGGNTLVPAQDSVTAFWPTNQHKTMPGLVLRLLHQLDWAMGAREQAEQSGLSF